MIILYCRETVHYMYFALAAYGWPMYLLHNKTVPIHKAAWKLCTGLRFVFYIYKYIYIYKILCKSVRASLTFSLFICSPDFYLYICLFVCFLFVNYFTPMDSLSLLRDHSDILWWIGYSFIIVMCQARKNITEEPTYPTILCN